MQRGSVTLAGTLDQAYGFSRNRTATVFGELATTEEIRLKATEDTIRAADACRRGGPDLAEQMIASAESRSSADTLYTIDRQDGQLRTTALSPAAVK